MPSEIADFFNSIPLITRYWFTTSLVLPLLGKIGLIKSVWMYLDWDLVISKFHVSFAIMSNSFFSFGDHLLHWYTFILLLKLDFIGF